MVTVNTSLSENQLPDGPKAPPLFQIFNWISRPFEYLEECTDKYGDIFTIRLLGFPPFVFIGNPQGIKDIFAGPDAQHFDASHINQNGGGRLIMGDNSLILMDGARHERERKLLMPPFHGDKVKSYAKSICEITEKVASRWKIDQPFIGAKITEEITIKVIIQAVFGFNEGEKCEQLRSAIAHWLELTSSPTRLSFIFLKPLQVDLGPWSPWGNFIRAKQKIYDLFQAEIADKRTHPEKRGNDILSLMLSATDSEGQAMSDAELKDELITLLSAGHETTANALAWAFYWLAKNPSVKEKLLQEIDSLGENPDPIQISRLPYLTAVCQETLRIYPVVQVALARFAKQDVQIMGRSFKAGTTFIPSIYSVHHREDLYPNSNQFKPERFLEREYTAYEFLPFGGGVRRCLGHALAMLELKLVIASIVSKYNLELADDKPIKPIRQSAVVVPSNGVPLVLTGFR
jgi:cytochrome P450